MRKYADDEDWLCRKRGFSMDSARMVVDALGKFQSEKLLAIQQSLVQQHPDQWTLLPAFIFTADDVVKTAHIDREVVLRVLQAFTLPDSARNVSFRALQDFNETNAAPLLRGPNQDFLLFQQYSLAEAIYDSPFYWMASDAVYRDAAMLHRGQFAEGFCKERLELVFGKEHVFSNVEIFEQKGRRSGEIDVLVLFGDRAIVLQAKSKKLTLEARKGNDNRIRDDFKKAVQDAYDQAFQCAGMLSDRSLKFLCGGQEINIPEQLKKVYIFCVVVDHYPALSFQARQFLKATSTATIEAPFITDIFTVDVMTEMLESPLRLLSYIDRRAGYSERLLVSHELVILSHHLRSNLWLEDKHDMALLEDGLSADLDVAMSVRRDGIPGRRTPEGILTRLANTALGKILKQIEAKPDPGTLAFGFLVLMLSEHAVVDISRALEMTARRTLNDGQLHDLSVLLDEAESGLTIHCNGEPFSEAAVRLGGHCELRKHVSKAKTWHGLCVTPQLSLRFGITLDHPWKPSVEMDLLAQRLQGRGTWKSFRGKVGPNEKCPCGSGRKYKKCCIN